MARSILVKLVLAYCAIVAVNTPARADSVTFTTLPAGGSISGPASSTIGWGYTIVNLSSNWLVTTGLSADPFMHGTPDALLFDFPILGPGEMVSVGFDDVTGLGLYGLHWDGNAPNGFTNSGMFILSAEVWDGDPVSGGIFLTNAPDQSAPYKATVSDASVPEPPTVILLGIAAIALFVTKSKRQNA